MVAVYDVSMRPSIPRAPSRRVRSAVFACCVAALSSYAAPTGAGPSAFPSAPVAAAPDAALVVLHDELARRYFDPTVHLRLAKLALDRGRMVGAYLQAESARRRFGDEKFDAAFQQVFRGREPLDASPEAQVRLAVRIAHDPGDFEATSRLAEIFVSRSDWHRAEPLLAEAVSLRPADPGPVTALADVYRRWLRPRDAERVEAEYEARNAGREEVVVAKVLREKHPARRGAGIEAALRRFPENGVLWFERAVIAQTDERDLAAAERFLTKAAALVPGDARIQGWTGRFFLRTRPDLALRYTLAAYFLDPYFYDSELVTSRIGRLLGAERRIACARVSGRAQVEAALADANPVIVLCGLEAARKQWEPAYLPRVTDLLASGDEDVASRAVVVLANKPDASADPALRGLLDDPAPVRRGRAAHIAVMRWHEAELPVLTRWLDDDRVLLRLEASRALAASGDKGRAIAIARIDRERDPELRRLLESLRDAPQDPPSGGAAAAEQPLK